MGWLSGPSWATGVASLQIVIRWPFATAARSFEKWVLASWIFTVFVMAFIAPQIE